VTRTLGLIPARGGSKGIARKNLACLAGVPLIAHTIESARKAASIDRVIVSTDDEEIAAVARSFGAEVPFMRPAELADDTTPDLPVFVHALEWLQQHEGCTPALIAHLRPTSPFRTARHIDEAVLLLRDHPDADSVRSVAVPSETPFKMWQIEEGRLSPLLAIDRETEPWNLPRQSLPTVYWQNACIDVIRYDTIMIRRSMSGACIVPYVMDDAMIDIDTPLDLQLAEWAMARRNR
jgi:N-acylneuraminate cytidylyltransferase